MADTKTRPISFRVEESILDALEAAGISPTEVSRAALARHARLLAQKAALTRVAQTRETPPLPEDASALIRRERDTP